MSRVGKELFSRRARQERHEEQRLDARATAALERVINIATPKLQCQEELRQCARSWYEARTTGPDALRQAYVRLQGCAMSLGLYKLPASLHGAVFGDELGLLSDSVYWWHEFLTYYNEVVVVKIAELSSDLRHDWMLACAVKEQRLQYKWIAVTKLEAIADLLERAAARQAR